MRCTHPEITANQCLTCGWTRALGTRAVVADLEWLPAADALAAQFRLEPIEEPEQLPLEIEATRPRNTGKQFATDAPKDTHTGGPIGPLFEETET